MNIFGLVRDFEKKQMDILSQTINHPEFSVGDTLKVMVHIEEGGKKWTQTCEGVCISKVNRGIASSFTVHRLESGQSIQMTYPMWLNNITINVLKRGVVRRAKLYYLQYCSKQAGRIKEKKFVKGTTAKTSSK